MRELVADRLEPELGKMTSNKTRSKKSKQKNSDHTTKGDPHNSHKAQVISDGDTSEEGGHSSDSDVEERPPRRDLHADTATTGTTSQQLRRVPGLVTIKARRPEFRPLLNYRTYRLNDMRVDVTETDTLRVNSLLKRMRHHLEYRYTGTPQLKVLNFLATFKEAMDVNRVCEGLAALLLPHALDGDARSGVQAFWKQNGGKVPKYAAAVNYLLESYATEAVIDQTTKAVLTASQAPGENEDVFASRLRRHAAEAGNVFTEDTLISVYIAGLHPYAANTVRGQVNPSTNFAAVRNLAIQAGAAGRARVPSQVSPMGMVPPRQKVTVASVDDSSSFGAHGYTPSMGQARLQLWSRIGTRMVTENHVGPDRRSRFLREVGIVPPAQPLKTQPLRLHPKGVVAICASEGITLSWSVPSLRQKRRLWCSRRGTRSPLRIPHLLRDPSWELSANRRIHPVLSLVLQSRRLRPRAGRLILALGPISCCAVRPHRRFIMLMSRRDMFRKVPALIRSRRKTLRETPRGG